MKVLVTGSFDLLHSGHVTFLKRAAAFGDLYVGIGSDYSIEKYKGKPPVCPVEERLYMLRELKCVKEAFINSGEGPFDFMNDLFNLQPDILVVNQDQDMTKKRDFCRINGIKYIVLERTQEPGLPFGKPFPARSTTELRKLL